VNVGTTVQPNDADLYNTAIGCVATPVVDVAGGFIYSLCDVAGPAWKLFKHNLADGTTAHAAVTMAGTANSHTFDASIELSRVALTLSSGQVYVAFGSYFDLNSYIGFVMEHSASDLSQTNMWSDVSASGSQAGIWMSGGGISVDSSGNLFLITGNGTCNSGSNTDYGESIVKLNASLVVQDWMSPSNCSTLNTGDTDLGASRAVLIGDTPVMGGGKDGRWWVLNTASMGHINSSSPNFTAAGGVFNSIAYANGSLYLGIATGSSTEKVYKRDWNGTTFSSVSATSATSYAFPGPQIAYSSNGSTAGSGIIWAITCDSSADSTVVAGTLRALNADTLAEIYNSGSGADAMGNFSKFVPPTVANGKVFVGTWSNKVSVYGLPAAAMLSSGASLGGSASIH
jgi:hypothetical protein